jgi:predicted transcriptional regulator
MIEMVITALLVINIFVVLLLFFTQRDVQNIKLLNQQTHAAMGTLVGRLLVVEQHTAKISQSMVELMNFAEHIMDNFEVDITSEYRTPDGKYSARSIDELMEKIKTDETKNKPSDDFMNDLRNLFENGGGDDYDDDDEDDEEDYKK